MEQPNHWGKKFENALTNPEWSGEHGDFILLIGY